MTGWIVGAVAAGMLAGHFVLPAEWAAHCGALITLGLCLLLFLVGVDMGRQGNVWRDIRQAGARVLAIPVAAAAGTLAAAAVPSDFDTVLHRSQISFYPSSLGCKIFSITF